jgi:hypothetical protein
MFALFGADKHQVTSIMLFAAAWLVFAYFLPTQKV